MFNWLILTSLFVVAVLPCSDAPLPVDADQITESVDPTDLMHQIYVWQ